MRHLIVNADDLGASPGITRGILDAHARGIVTSASLMVDTPWSGAAAVMSRATPRLSVGLHVVLPEGAAPGDGAPESTRDDENAGAALQRQLDRFTALMGCLPTHIDSHHDVHRQPRHLPAFLALARALGRPLRGHSAVHSYASFYGRWGGESHPEHVSFESLEGMLAREIGDGITELSCHPGYLDAHVQTGYAGEREVELGTLCDRRLPDTLAALGITLASFHDLGRLTPAGAAR